MLFRNGLVLALHALACVAGLHGRLVAAAGGRGLLRASWRRIHELAGPLAIAFVAAATLFSLVTQAYALGHGASTLAAELGVSPLLLMLGLLPHALPELFALFLPLAAWTLASRARPLGGAARRHLRDHRDRRPDPARRGRASRSGCRPGCCSRSSVSRALYPSV